MTAPGQQPPQNVPPQNVPPQQQRPGGAPLPPQEQRPSGAASAQKSKRTYSVGQILGGLLFVLIVIFIVENTEKVKIRLIAGPKVSMPVYLALLIAAVVGALVAALLRYRRQRHHSEK